MKGIKIRIAIINITGGGISGGYLKYLKNIIPRIANENIVDDIIVGLPGLNNYGELKNELSNVQFMELEIQRIRNIINCTIQNRDYKNIQEYNPTIIFIPTARYIKIGKIPIVNMVRNMEPLVKISNNPIGEKIANFMRKRLAMKSVLFADRTIAVSNYVKKTIIRMQPNCSEKIDVVYHGVGQNERGQKRPDCIKNDKPGSFIFSAGSIRPARGIEDLVNVLANGLIANNSNIIFAGKASNGMGKFNNWLHKLANIKKVNKRIKFVGNLTDSEMEWCYRNCEMFIMTSKVEACPNILLEALSNQCICVSTNCDPMPEFLGENGIYYPAGNHDKLAEKIQFVRRLTNKKRMEIRQKNEENLKKYSWEKTSKETLKVLIHACKSR